jgi:hypothetical protein
MCSNKTASPSVLCGTASTIFQVSSCMLNARPFFPRRTRRRISAIIEEIYFFTISSRSLIMTHTPVILREQEA